jgi:hypothetical protein
MKETLDNLLSRYQHLSDYAETKLGILIGFNSAIIFGLLAIFKNQNEIVKYAILGVVLLNSLSLFFAFSGVFAKRKNKHSSSKITESKNYYYYKYIAQLNESSFLENLTTDYKLESKNLQLEKDISNQIVVLAKNADRKFRFFNIAMSFTIASLITPLGLLVFHIYNNPNW